MNSGNPTFEDKLELALQDTEVKKAFETFLEKYLKENLSLTVDHDHDYYSSGFKVSLFLKDTLISKGSFTLKTDSY